MNDAIEELVGRFVDELLSLAQQARDDSRTAALNVVTSMLVNMGRPAEPQKPTGAHPTALVKSSRGRRHEIAATSKAAPVTSAKSETAPPSAATSTPTTSTKREKRAQRTGDAAPATRRSLVPEASTSPSPVVTFNETASSADTASVTASAVPEREALVLDAVRALVRATAAEIAERSGQPNGSVYVTLRGLVARGLVAKTETARGIEYSLVSAGRVQPFKRAKRAGAADAPTVDQASAAHVS